MHGCEAHDQSLAPGWGLSPPNPRPWHRGSATPCFAYTPLLN